MQTKKIALESVNIKLNSQIIALQNKCHTLVINHQNAQTHNHKQPLEEIFNPTPIEHLSKIQNISLFTGDSTDIVKEKLTESLYKDYVSIANQKSNSQMNFLGWSKLRNITPFRYNFPTISFDYSFSQTIENEDLLFKA